MTTVLSFPSSYASGFAGSGSVLPLVPAPQQYAVNGVLLVDQPVIATAPVPMGRCIPRGSTFALSFSNPGSATKSALATSSQCALTFVLLIGELVTGQVQIASTLVTSGGGGGGGGGGGSLYVPRIFSGTYLLPDGGGGGGPSTSMLLVSVTLLSDLFLSS